MTGRRRTTARWAGWAALVALLVLATRAIAYAMSGSPEAIALHLRGEVGGPTPVMAAVVGLGLAGLVSAALVWLATMGARERWALDPRRNGRRPPRVPVGRVATRALALWVASSVAFACFESYLHWRAGLGFHGLHCLIGPMHADALPISATLSLLAASATTAAAHLLRWMRGRLGDAFAARPPAHRALVLTRSLAPLGAASRIATGSLGARGPPLLLCG